MNNKDESILKYYVMPLLSISPTVLGDKYVTSYLHRDGYMFIQFKPDCSVLIDNPSYEGTIDIGNITFHIFVIPLKFLKDFKLIVNGEYSKLSDAAKNNIIALSGLDYNKKYNPKNPNEITTSAQLLALYRHHKLREKRSRDLDVAIDESTELWEKLTDKAFIENVVEHEQV